MKDSETVLRLRAGILPRDGRNITYPQMTAACRSVYNFAPSFAYFTTNVIGNLLTRDYYKDTINLSDVSVHNGIEHDASLTRTFISVLLMQIHAASAFVHGIAFTYMNGKDMNVICLLI